MQYLLTYKLGDLEEIVLRTYNNIILLILIQLPAQKKGETRGMLRKTNASRCRIAVLGKGIFGPSSE